jgi:hypothetical protein
MGGCIHRSDTVADLLEFLGYRGQFIAVAGLQSGGEPGGKPRAGSFDNGGELLQAGRTRAVAELGSRLQAHNFDSELPMVSGNFGGRPQNVDRLADGALTS